MQRKAYMSVVICERTRARARQERMINDQLDKLHLIVFVLTAAVAAATDVVFHVGCDAKLAHQGSRIIDVR